MHSETISSQYTREIVLPAQSEDLTMQGFWTKWLLAVAVVVLVFSISMDIAPYLHSDEFMILDLGRIILNPHTEWSITWITKLDHPALLWSYVGPVLQELTYQVAGQYGPRISALLGAVTAATIMVGWLRAREISKNVSILLGLTFLLDPLFVQSYTMGRVDGWTMALCLAACWMLRDTTRKLPYSRFLNWRLLLAGALTTTAFFTWPSAAFLFPLILLEVIDLAIKYKSTGRSWRESAMLVFVFGSGCLLTGVLLLLPIAPLLFTQFTNIMVGLKTNTRSGSELERSPFYLNAIRQFIELFRVLKFTPIVLLLSIAGLIGKREQGLVIAVLTSVTLMVFTVVYIHRVQYLLPYFIVAIAGIFQHGFKLGTTRFVNRVRKGGLAMLLIWCIGLSVCFRSILAFHERAYRNRDLVFQAAQTMIGKGSYRVLLIPYEFYYAGRSLGWQMFRPYLATGEAFSANELHNILPHVNYVIANNLTELPTDFTRQLEKDGMHAQEIYFVYAGPVEKFTGKTTNMTRIRNLYSIFRQPYGPYQLYKREAN